MGRGKVCRQVLSLWRWHKLTSLHNGDKNKNDSDDERGDVGSRNPHKRPILEMRKLRLGAVKGLILGVGATWSLRPRPLSLALDHPSVHFPDG